MSDCKFVHNCGNGLKCSECPDYEQDPQIARDNDTAEVATKEPDYERLLNMQSIILVDKCQEISKLEYDNQMMSGFIMKSGRVFKEAQDGS